MAYGEGSITEAKKKDGTSFSPKHWKVCVTFGSDPITGKRQRVQRTVRGSKKDALDALAEIRAQRDGGLVAQGDTVTFGEYAAEWQEARAATGEVGRERLEREATMIRDMVALVGGTRLRDINPRTVSALIARIRRDKGVSGTTLNMYYKTFRQILSSAVDNELIPRNPTDKVKAPRIEQVERRSLSEEEGRELMLRLDEAEEEAYRQREEVEARQAARGDESERSYLRSLSAVGNVIGARVALATGMRRGEVLGLTWDSVDLEGGIVHVNRAVTKYLEVKGPKSAAGRRSLHVDGKTVAHLARWKQFQHDELALLGRRQTGTTPVCCNDMGELMIPTNFSRWWRGFSEEAGFPGLRFHELRHTQATQLIAAGIDLKTVQTRLGHASATLTLDLYSHAVPAKDEEAGRLIGELFSPRDGGNGPGGGSGSTPPLAS